jgi:hypothetical protein
MDEPIIIHVGYQSLNINTILKKKKSFKKKKHYNWCIINRLTRGFQSIIW